jgi:hypothetical protein
LIGKRKALRFVSEGFFYLGKERLGTCFVWPAAERDKIKRLKVAAFIRSRLQAALNGRHCGGEKAKLHFRKTFAFHTHSGGKSEGFSLVVSHI